jgi:hypothetical protein
MRRARPTRTTSLLSAGLLLCGLVAVTGSVAPGAAADSRSGHGCRGPDGTAASSVLLDWQTSAIRTVYTENAQPVPVGALYLGFTSLAVLDAVRHAPQGQVPRARAAAVAAHDVLAAYFPASASALDADLASTLGSLPATSCDQAASRTGQLAAARMIASRTDDGRGDPSYVYSRPAAPGVWQPPATGMLAPWLGFVRPLVLRHVLTGPGPDALDSAAYADDYDEVRRLGAVDSTERSAFQTDTALFFNSSSATMLTEALVRRLHDQPLSVGRTAFLFGAGHGAMADAIIAAWRLKYEVGFWRPFQAIAGAADDGNPETEPQTGWSSLLPTPPYSDYISGHASLTGPMAEVVRRVLGDHTPLVLHSYSTGADRSYATLSGIETEAKSSRIWGGLHFRKAMDDGYAIAHRTARAVLRELR